MKNEHIDNKRRALLKQGTVLTGLSISGAMLPSLIAGCEKDTVKSKDEGYAVDISTRTELSSLGSSIKETFSNNNSGKPVIIIRSEENSFTVLSAVCTHQGCFVNKPASVGNNIFCSCHGSTFSALDGSVIEGPATSPLKLFTSTFDSNKNILYIKF
ncbi:ubiquinol-cytochrome c reductase iron-sulfur subunit [Candidatus Latescibacterota bacterium]